MLSPYVPVYGPNFDVLLLAYLASRLGFVSSLLFSFICLTCIRRGFNVISISLLASWLLFPVLSPYLLPY